MANDFTISQSKKKANVLTLSDPFQKHKGSTGYILLLYADTHEVLKTLKYDQSEEELKQEGICIKIKRPVRST